jgi:hypothetical protein
MTRSIPENHPLNRLFRGLTEHTFHAELGIGDPRLVGYVSDLLVRFVPAEAAYGLRDSEGRRLTDVFAMLAAAGQAEGDARRRECLRHVGDFTLFHSGVFPEAAQASGALMEYQQHGKRSYYLASTYAEDEESSLLRRLSAEFEVCAFGLSRVRKEWESLPAQEAQRGGRSILSA